jgi:hypothetical protein
MSARSIAALVLVMLMAACSGETPYPAHEGPGSPSDGGPYNPVSGGFATP